MTNAFVSLQVLQSPPRISNPPEFKIEQKHDIDSLSHVEEVSSSDYSTASSSLSDIPCSSSPEPPPPPLPVVVMAVSSQQHTTGEDEQEQQQQQLQENGRDDDLLLCLEEINYHDESGDEALSGLPSSTQLQPNPAVTAAAAAAAAATAAAATNGGCTIAVTSPDSPHDQFLGYVSSNTTAVLFSPSTPWLSSTSPQIANVFGSISPPMQPLQTQNTTPKLHHYTPPTNIYSPTCFLPGGSPKLFSLPPGDMNSELHWIAEDGVIIQ